MGLHPAPGQLTRLLVVTAVEAERDAVLAGLADALPGGADPVVRRTGPLSLLVLGDVGVVAGGVGPAAAAAAAATVLSALTEPPELVVSAGIAGAFAGRAEIGDLVAADQFVAADLGSDSDAGFLDLDTLGFGTSTLPALAPALATAVTVGPVLTVSTATGTDARAAELARRSDAVAEAMEGFGVATAASLHGVPAAELRGISNRVGRRDRAAWDVGAALAAVRRGATALAQLTALAELPRTGGRA